MGLLGTIAAAVVKQPVNDHSFRAARGDSDSKSNDWASKSTCSNSVCLSRNLTTPASPRAWQVNSLILVEQTASSTLV